MNRGFVGCENVFNHARNIFQVLSRKIDGFGPRAQVGDLAEASGTVYEKEEVVAEV